MTAHNGDDERLRAAFEDLKRDDVRVRSTYASVVARGTRQRASLFASPVLRLAAAVVVLVAAAVTYTVGFRREPKFRVPREVIALGAWRPETDVLLASPTKLLQAQTGIRESMIDVDTLTRGVLP
jgi:hypothetical protein